MSTINEVIRQFDVIQQEIEGLSSFSFGENWTKQLKDETNYPNLFLELPLQERVQNGNVNYQGAFYVFDQVDSADTEVNKLTSYTKLQQLAWAVMKYLSHRYESQSPYENTLFTVPFDYNLMLLPETGLDRVYGYRVEFQLNATFIFSLCTVPLTVDYGGQNKTISQFDVCNPTN